MAEKPQSSPQSPQSPSQTTGELEKKMEKLTTQESLKPTVADLDENVTVQVQQDDPNSPLHSAKKFEELNLSKELLDGVYAMGFKRPSKIQENALPIILGNKNIIAQAQSGTGKTAAFVLGMLSKCDSSKPYPQALCACPTRELARQIIENVKSIGQFTKIETCLVSGDEIFKKKIREQIVVGTPGKLLRTLEDGIITGAQIKILVLDEADMMIEGSLGEQVKKLKRHINPKCQFLLFSATFRDEVYQYATKFVPSPRAEITLKKEELSIKGIQQYYIQCGNEAGKLKILEEIYGYLTVGQSIIFLDSRKSVYELHQRMIKAGHQVGMFSADLESDQRDRVIDDFRSARIKVMISSDVLGRGVDILGVTLVINYELPYHRDERLGVNFEQYLHRVGRSGRFGRRGIAINLVDTPQSKAHVEQIAAHFKRPIEEYPPNKLDELSPQLENIITDNQREILKRAEEEAKKESEKLKANPQKPTQNSPQNPSPQSTQKPTQNPPQNSSQQSSTQNPNNFSFGTPNSNFSFGGNVSVNFSTDGKRTVVPEKK